MKIPLGIVANVNKEKPHTTKSALTPPIPRGKAGKKLPLPESVAVISAPSAIATVQRNTENPAAKYQKHVQKLRKLSREHQRKLRKSPIPHGSKILKRSSEELKILTKKEASADIATASDVFRKKTRAQSKDEPKGVHKTRGSTKNRRSKSRKG